MRLLPLVLVMVVLSWSCWSCGGHHSRRARPGIFGVYMLRRLALFGDLRWHKMAWCFRVAAHGSWSCVVS